LFAKLLCDEPVQKKIGRTAGVNQSGFAWFSCRPE